MLDMRCYNVDTVANGSELAVIISYPESKKYCWFCFPKTTRRQFNGQYFSGMV